MKSDRHATLIYMITSITCYTQRPAVFVPLLTCSDLIDWRLCTSEQTFVQTLVTSRHMPNAQPIIMQRNLSIQDTLTAKMKKRAPILKEVFYSGPVVHTLLLLISRLISDFTIHAHRCRGKLSTPTHTVHTYMVPSKHLH